MQISRGLVGATLTGVLVFTAVPRAQAIDPYTLGLLSQILSGSVQGAPYGAPGPLSSGGYGMSPYGPYGNPPSGLYRSPQYGLYGAPPPYGSYGLGGRYSGPMPGTYGSSPYDAYRGRGYRYPYQNQLNYDYAKAMSRLDRQEAEASAKAYRKSYGNPAQYSERMAQIERKYAYKRYKVERNTARSYGYR